MAKSKPKPQPVALDLNNPWFQKQLFSLEPSGVTLVFRAFKKLMAMEWPELLKPGGFNWEAAGHTEPAPNGASIKSIRITKKVRALAYRDENWMRLLSIHFDHDSAYR